MVLCDDLNTFLNNKSKYELPDDFNISELNKKYHLLGEKNLLFEIEFDKDNRVNLRAYFIRNKFIIHDFNSTPRRKGYGTKCLKYIKELLCKHNISLCVTDITSFAFPFWMKMYEENIIINIIYNNCTIEDVINNRVSENENKNIFYDYKLYKIWDKETPWLEHLYLNWS